MAVPMPPVGVPIFELRIKSLLGKPNRNHPFALVIAVAESGHGIEIDEGTRKGLRNIRNQICVSLRSDNAVLDALAQAIAPVVRSAKTQLINNQEPVETTP